MDKIYSSNSCILLFNNSVLFVLFIITHNISYRYESEKEKENSKLENDNFTDIIYRLKHRSYVSSPLNSIINVSNLSYVFILKILF